MKCPACIASREPTSQEGTSFVSAQIAVHVQTSPNPRIPSRSGETFFCLQ